MCNDSLLPWFPIPLPKTWELVSIFSFNITQTTAPTLSFLSYNNNNQFKIT